MALINTFALSAHSTGSLNPQQGGRRRSHSVVRPLEKAIKIVAVDDYLSVLFLFLREE